jgi:hypothetical protein
MEHAREQTFCCPPTPDVIESPGKIASAVVEEKCLWLKKIDPDDKIVLGYGWIEFPPVTGSSDKFFALKTEEGDRNGIS